MYRFRIQNCVGFRRKKGGEGAFPPAASQQEPAASQQEETQEEADEDAPPTPPPKKKKKTKKEGRRMQAAAPAPKNKKVGGSGLGGHGMPRSQKGSHRQWQVVPSRPRAQRRSDNLWFLVTLFTWLHGCFVGGDSNRRHLGGTHRSLFYSSCTAKRAARPRCCRPWTCKMG